MLTRLKIHSLEPALNVFFRQRAFQLRQKLGLPETPKLKIQFSRISPPHFSFSQKITRFNNEKVSN